MKKRFKSWIVFGLAACLIVSACSKKDDRGPAAIEIDGHRITAQEFSQEFAERGGKDTPAERERFLEALVTRKLLLQEARRRGLDTDAAFLESIEAFWEQSLIRAVVARRVAETGGSAAPSEEQIASAYAAWQAKNPGSVKPLDEVRDLIVWQIKNQNESAALKQWLDEIESGAQIRIDRAAIGLE